MDPRGVAKPSEHCKTEIEVQRENLPTSKRARLKGVSTQYSVKAHTNIRTGRKDIMEGTRVAHRHALSRKEVEAVGGAQHRKRAKVCPANSRKQTVSEEPDLYADSMGGFALRVSVEL